MKASQTRRLATSARFLDKVDDVLASVDPDQRLPVGGPVTYKTHPWMCWRSDGYRMVGDEEVPIVCAERVGDNALELCDRHMRQLRAEP